MKLTKAKLKKLIQEELDQFAEAHDEDSPSVTRPGEEDYTGHKGDDSKTHSGEKDYESDGPQVEWEISYEDGRVFARGMDPDTFEGDDPMEIELDPAKLYAAIDSGELELEKESGPEAGSMPMSQSPAYSDKEKEAIKKRRIKMGFGHEYDQ